MSAPDDENDLDDENWNRMIVEAEQRALDDEALELGQEDE